MLIRKNARKQQLGGSLNLAKSITPTLDIRLNAPNPEAFKEPALQIPSSLYSDSIGGGSGRSSGIKEGLPSDVQLATDEIKKYKQRIQEGLSANANYDTASDSEQIEKWSNRIAELKSREDNYTKTKTTIGKTSNDDYAISGGKAFVKDITTGDYDVVDENALLSERAQVSEGKTMARYMPATIADALTARFSDKRFSGFTAKGTDLDNILTNASPIDQVYTSMDKLFNQAAVVNTATQKVMLTKTGQESSLDDVMKIFTVGTSEASNKKSLEQAIGLFAGDIDSAQMQALTNKATASFVREHAEEEVSPAQAKEWIRDRVINDIVTRAKVYLSSKVTGKTSASGGSGGSEDEDAMGKINDSYSKVTLARITATSNPVQIESRGQWTGEIKEKISLLGTFGAAPLPINTAVAAGTKDPAKDNIATNAWTGQVSGGRKWDNFFLADRDGTPVQALNSGKGLETAIFNPGQEAQVLTGVPYITENGRNKIAWDFVDDARKWGLEYGRQQREFLKSKGRAITSPLTDQEKKDLQDATNKATGFNPGEKNIEIGDVVMMPILGVQNGSYSSPLDGVLSEDLEPWERAELEAKKWGKTFTREEYYKTYAFSVLGNDTNSFLDKSHYGSAMEVGNVINRKTLYDNMKNNAAMNGAGRELLARFAFGESQKALNEK